MPLLGLRFLEHLASWEGTRFTPFEDVLRLYASFGDPQDNLATIHVGGTNGKGSVCALLAAMLHATGAKVGHFASPHLTQVTERCLINGEPVGAKEFDLTVLEVKDQAESLGIELSFFVTTALATSLIFSRRKLDWVVLEVGLGGTFDATNTVKTPKAAVVTSLGYDHLQLLGPTLEDIARNKAGIAKRGVPLFCGEIPASVEHVFRRRADELSAPIYCWGREFVFDSKTSLVQRDNQVEPLAVPKEATSFFAPYQRRNVALATVVADAVGVHSDAIHTGARIARWPGRAEWICDGSVLLDAAHNPDGVEALCEMMERTFPSADEAKEVVIVVSILERKDWQEMLRRLGAFCDRLLQRDISVRCIVSRMKHHLSLDPRSARGMLPNLTLCDSAEEAAATISRASKNEGTKVIVTGSIYFLGQVRPLLTETPFRTIAPPS